MALQRLKEDLFTVVWILFFRFEGRNNLKTLELGILFVFILTFGFDSVVKAECYIIGSDNKKTPFVGKAVNTLQVEKKSLIKLNKAYPNLNVIENTFKGEIQTCTNCSENYITCVGN